MNEHIRENYFLIMKLGMILAIEIFIEINYGLIAGATYKQLLLLALFLTMISIASFVKREKRLFWILMAFAAAGSLYQFVSSYFSLLFAIVILETLRLLKRNGEWYFITYLAVLLTPLDQMGMVFMGVSALVIIYYQHNIVIHSYRRQIKEDNANEQQIKSSMKKKESKYQQEISKSLLSTENQVLEDRQRISQALHDKLGHSINGSVYQLEACKVLLDGNPKQAASIIQMVIDALRTSMDEIRIMLRQERPAKRKLAMIQLQQLCEECKEKYQIQATLKITGDSDKIEDRHWEVILDNTFEAVSNALKYAKCTKIEISIIVMNQLIRCTILDNGVGCSNMEDGMGVSGMRKRVREVGGMITIEAEIGFVINMLLPRKK